MGNHAIPIIPLGLFMKLSPPESYGKDQNSMSANSEMPIGNGANLADLVQLWGKTGPSSTYHPALFHMLDVGNVARVLLGSAASPRFRHLLARTLNAAAAESLVGWLPLIVALHDIGKVSSPFQGQRSVPATQATRARLELAGFVFGPTHGEVHRHQLVSAAFVESEWLSLEPDLPRQFLLTIRDALAGHHGRFASGGELSQVRTYCQTEEPASWAAFRADAYSLLRAEFAPGWPGGASAVAPTHRMAATMALVGLTILSDWIGSDSAHFPLANGVALADYAPESARRAHAAARNLGFLQSATPVVYGGFASAFPDKPARPLQLAIDDLPAPALVAPALVIIEAPTGEGKTEAALALSRRLASTNDNGELYFGLPTTATSNQMFLRVSDFIARVEGASVKLVHGQAALVEDDLLLHHRQNGGEDAEGAAAIPGWFAPKKRALLAPYGVGTVDQVELATLNARYYMLRLFGLAGKVVIIDEVHAYDTYMSTILEQALRWLAALGSSVILLSATLPLARHRALARAFHPEAASSESEPLPYPCIAVYGAVQIQPLAPPPAQEQRTLHLEFVADATPEEGAGRLLALVRDGGAVCRICNTVAAAQDLFRALDALADPGIHRVLLHSRFPLEDRQSIERDLTARFGPASDRQPGDRAIVIGTQILEQSLDLDFDAMVSDLTPTDLLLQRAGRLHRHERSRSAAHQDATLRVQLPHDQSGKPRFGNWTWVYDEFILWQTWLVLQGRTNGQSTLTLTLPRDYRPLIEATYPEQPPPIADDEPFATERRTAFARHRREEADDAAEARLRLAPSPRPRAGIAEHLDLRFEEDDEGGAQGWGIAKTRQGTETVTIIPLHRHGTALTTDTEGRDPVGPACDRACQLRLLRRSLPVSHLGLIAALRANQANPPDWFREAALLRHTLPLILDGRTARLGNVIATLDPRLGLIIAKENIA